MNILFVSYKEQFLLLPVPTFLFSEIGLPFLYTSFWIPKFVSATIYQILSMCYLGRIFLAY